jgi:hypothetical protein
LSPDLVESQGESGQVQDPQVRLDQTGLMLEGSQFITTAVLSGTLGQEPKELTQMIKLSGKVLNRMERSGPQRSSQSE